MGKHANITAWRKCAEVQALNVEGGGLTHASVEGLGAAGDVPGDYHLTDFLSKSGFTIEAGWLADTLNVPVDPYFMLCWGPLPNEEVSLSTM